MNIDKIESPSIVFLKQSNALPNCQTNNSISVDNVHMCFIQLGITLPVVRLYMVVTTLSERYLVYSETPILGTA